LVGRGIGKSALKIGNMPVLKKPEINLKIRGPENPEASPSIRSRRLGFLVSLEAARIVLKYHGMAESAELDAIALSTALAVDEALHTFPIYPRAL
jgi:hypothetical protein